MKKLVLFLALVAFGQVAFAQAQTAEARAKTKSDGIIKFIDSKILDAAKKLNAKEKQAITTAYVNFELGQDSLKTRKEGLAKLAEEYKAKVTDLNARQTAFEAKAAIPASSEDEAKKLQEEQDGLKVTREEIKALKEKIDAEKEALKAYPDQIESRRDEAVKAGLPADKAKIFGDMREEQKKKKAAGN